MKNILFLMPLLFMHSCVPFGPPQAIGLTEDIVDDVVEMETGKELNLGPEHKNH